MVRSALVAAMLGAWRWAPAQQSGTGAGYILGPEAGEVLRRPNGQVIVKVDPRRGSRAMALGTQDLLAGAGIGVHRHEGADEILLIQQGRARAVLGDRRQEVGPGTTVYVPRGTWHGVESTGEAIRLVWVVTPPGLEGFFREIGAPPGAPLKQLTPAQMGEIARRHGTAFQAP